MDQKIKYFLLDIYSISVKLLLSCASHFYRENLNCYQNCYTKRGVTAVCQDNQKPDLTCHNTFVKSAIRPTSPCCNTDGLTASVSVLLKPFSSWRSFLLFCFHFFRVQMPVLSLLHQPFRICRVPLATLCPGKCVYQSKIPERNSWSGICQHEKSFFPLQMYYYETKIPFLPL